MIAPQRRLCLVLPVVALAACGAEPPLPAPRTGRTDAKLEPAPMPHAPYVRRSGPQGALEIPIPPKMPLGTGAVPVSGSAFRGSVVTGVRRSFWPPARTCLRCGAEMVTSLATYARRPENAAHPWLPA